MTTTRTKTGRALVVVDVQNDFVEGGSLAVTGGRACAARVAEHMLTNRADYDVIIVTRDWHDADNDNGGHFHAPGIDPDYTDTWPRHCVAGTHGAEWADEIRDAIRRTAHDLVSKGQGQPAYSGFEGTNTSGNRLVTALRAAGVTDVDVCGIATDYCVKATALDAVENGFRTHLLPGLHVGVDPTTSAQALGKMAANGVEVLEGVFRP